MTERERLSVMVACSFGIGVCVGGGATVIAERKAGYADPAQWLADYQKCRVADTHLTGEFCQKYADELDSKK